MPDLGESCYFSMVKNANKYFFSLKDIQMIPTIGLHHSTLCSVLGSGVSRKEEVLGYRGILVSIDDLFMTHYDIYRAGVNQTGNPGLFTS